MSIQSEGHELPIKWPVGLGEERGEMRLPSASTIDWIFLVGKWMKGLAKQHLLLDHKVYM